MAGRGMPADPTEAVKWHIIAKAGGASDPDLDVFASQQTPAVRDAAEKAAKKWLDAIEGAASAWVTLHGSAPSRGHDPRAMHHSPLLNVMIAAARKTARALKRDFGELEKLQVSLKGPANFVSSADRRAEETLYQELGKARPGYGFLGEEGGIATAPTSRIAGSSTRSTAPPISCTAFRNSRFRSRSNAKARWSPA